MLNMKSNILTPVSFIAYPLALVALPVSPLAAGLVATIAGLLSIGTLDYGRSSGPVTVPAEVLAFSSKLPALDDSRDAA
jgi:hypothetical protein